MLSEIVKDATNDTIRDVILDIMLDAIWDEKGCYIQCHIVHKIIPYMNLYEMHKANTRDVICIAILDSKRHN